MNTKARTLDLLRKISGVLVTPPETLPKSSDTQQRILQHVEAIARRLFILPQLPSAMATVTFSIGTTGRDYSTIAGWEADLDNAGLYSAADDAVGECYNDAAFNESFAINGGSVVGLNSIRLTAAAGNRHDGTAGSGVRIVASTTRTFAMVGSVQTTVEWIEFDFNDQTIGLSPGIDIDTDPSVIGVLANCLIHDLDGTSHTEVILLDDPARVLNCVIYDLSNNNGERRLNGIKAASGSGADEHSIYNTVIHNVVKPSGTAECYCVYVTADVTDRNIKNVIAGGATGGGAGPVAAFGYAGTSSAVLDYCLDDDSTLPSGINNVLGATISSQFVSIVDGSEDYHLKTGADAIDAGADLGTTPSGIAIDIDGRDRDAEGDTWDIGADEFVAAGGGTSTATAGLVLAAAIAAGSASFTAPGPFTASAALSSPPAIVDAAGTTSVPNRTATADLIASAAIADASGTVENPVFSATAALQSPSVLAAGAASFADAIFSATAGLSVPSATVDGSATFSPPEFTASASLSVGSVAASGSATFATSLFQSTAALQVPAAAADLSASFVAPSYSGSATLIVAAPIVDASSSEFNVSDYYYQFLLGSGA